MRELKLLSLATAAAVTAVHAQTKDASHLIRISGRWKVLKISDTFRQSGCGDPW